MNQYDLDEADKFKGDPNYNDGFQRFDMSPIDQPLRSPIRRKDKFPQAMGTKPKVKRSYKKVQNKIKYDWQGE